MRFAGSTTPTREKKESKLREKKKKQRETIDSFQEIERKRKRMQETIYMDFVIFAPWNATQGSLCR